MRAGASRLGSGVTKRELAIRVLDAVEDGSTGEVIALCLNALEDGKRVVRCRCPRCGLGFEWPGLLDAHLLACDPESLAA